jgi:cytochrome c oxidase cbb3-type subunit 4
MDMNDIRSWYTVVMFAVFIGIVLWAWSGKTKRRFNEAEQLPFNESEYPLDNKNEGDRHE